MNPQDRQRTQRRLEELEAQIDQTQPLSDEPETSPSLQGAYHQTLNWVKSLPKEGQIVVVLGGVFLGVSLLSTLVKLVSLLFTLAFLGVFLYIGYRSFRENP